MIHILVVEDQKLFLGALANLIDLEDDLNVVGKAENGKDALALLDTHHLDLVVTDIEMPEMTGLELATNIKKRGLDTRILIVTTFGRNGYLSRAIEADVDGYVLKDTPSEEFTKIIRKIMSGEKYISPELRHRYSDEHVTRLSPREREILRLVEQGLSNAEIGKKLNKAAGTIRNNLHEVTQKTGCRNRIEAARLARQNGWL
jgi:two-component system response regulator DesR